jgi:hypothetical protein
MAAQTYNIKTHKSGDTFPGVQFQLAINGSNKSLDGAVINMKVGIKLFSTSNNAIAITDASSGIFQFKEQIINLNPGTYKYTIQFIFPDGKKKTYITGTWVITE